MAFHALIGAGFLAATFLVRPFLPESEIGDMEEICGGGKGNGSLVKVDQEQEVKEGKLNIKYEWLYINI